MATIRNPIDWHKISHRMLRGDIFTDLDSSRSQVFKEIASQQAFDALDRGIGVVFVTTNPDGSAYLRRVAPDDMTFTGSFTVERIDAKK